MNHPVAQVTPVSSVHRLQAKGQILGNGPDLSFVGALRNLVFLMKLMFSFLEVRHTFVLFNFSYTKLT